MQGRQASGGSGDPGWSWWVKVGLASLVILANPVGPMGPVGPPMGSWDSMGARGFVSRENSDFEKQHT